MSLDDDARSELAKLEATGRLRVPRVVDGLQGPRVVLDGKRVLNFASNDYLSLAGDPRLARAAAAAFDTAGAGAGASRLIVGNHREHVTLEAALADWLRVTGVRLFNSGYAANVGTISALVGAGDTVISDELNHASIIDGCRLSRADVIVVPHRDLAAFERAVASRSGRKLVVSESLFSMDGDIADVEALAAVAHRHDAALMLDEAHALGVLGPEGRGIAAARGIVPDVLVGTHGKALGSFGAFVATSRAVADLLWNRARSLVFSTAIPPAVVASVRAALEIVRGTEGEDRRRTVARNASVLRRSSEGIGGDVSSPIAPLLVGDDRVVMQQTARLLEQGVFVQGIRPPTVPAGTARLRVSVSSGHSESDIGVLVDALRHR